MTKNWTWWLHNPCRLGGLTFRAGGQISNRQQSGLVDTEPLLSMGPQRLRLGEKISSGQQLYRMGIQPLMYVGYPTLQRGRQKQVVAHTCAW